MKLRVLLAIFILWSVNLIAQHEESYAVRWNNAMTFGSSDKDFQIKMGGRLQFDMMNIHEDDSLAGLFNAENGVELRRVRFYTSGKLYKIIEFKVQIDFAKGTAALKDVYLRFTHIPWVGNLQVGHFKEPMGLEMLTSSTNILDMERSLPEAFMPDRNLGLMIYRYWAGKRISGFAGYFYPSLGSGHYLGNAWHLTGRLVGVPYYTTTGNYNVIHLGASYSYQSLDEEAFDYEVRPESHLAPKYLNVDFDALRKTTKLNGELLVIHNQFLLQSELIINTPDVASVSVWPAGEYEFNSWYATASWMITGEHHEYVLGSGVLGRTTPKHMVGKDGGMGALEFTIRYSHMDMVAHDIQAGKLNDLTLGLNWYLNPVSRVTFNYINAHLANTGTANIFQVRFQQVF